MKKNVFIDCGTNLGQGLTLFNKKLSLFNNNNWDIYTFEPNPHIDLNSMFEGVANLTKINKAVWTNNNGITFTSCGKKDLDMRKKYNEERFQGGGSHISEVRTDQLPSHVETKEYSVETISFSDFIKCIQSNYHTIIVKFDIEGAEFPLIDDMIANDTLKYIDSLYMEPHGRFLHPENQDQITKVENELFAKAREHIKNVYVWY